MKKSAVLFFLVICVFTSACSAKMPDQADDENKEGIETIENVSFTKDTYPKVDGSTATIPLSEALAEELLGMTEDLAAEFVEHNKTHDAYVNLIEGNADIIFVTKPSQEELGLAKEANIELEVLPVIKEGFVFLVNTANPVESLSTEQVCDIYQGKIKNWKEAGGKDREIIAYQRPENSGSQTLMEQLVMKGLKMAEQPKTLIKEMGQLIEEVADYENSEYAIGYSVYYYAKTMYLKDNIKLLGINGIKPDNKTISDGTYPFTTAYYAVIKKSEAKDSPARKLLGWVLGKEGQRVCENAGYVPLKAGR